MPLHDSFLQMFKPQNGDLVYGLHDARQAYLKSMALTAEQLDAVNGYAWCIVDDRHNMQRKPTEMVTPERRAGQVDRPLHPRTDDHPLAAADRDREARRKERLDRARRGQNEMQFDRFEATRHSRSRLAPEATLELQRRDLRKEVFDVPKHSPQWPWRWSFGERQAVKSLGSTRAARRLCKLGIGLAEIDERFLSRRAKIHFILDGIDLRAAAEQARHEMAARVTTPYGSSELCHVFRNWGRLRNAVYFYVNRLPVDAPWDADWEATSIANLGPVRSARDAWPG